jgi:hypothetical protein
MANENSSQQVAATPSTAMVERAREVVRNPAAGINEILGAASSLIVWGVLDDAEDALERVAASGRFRGEVRALSERIWRLRNAPREFTDRLLVNAIAIARSEAASETQLMLAAEDLVKWGSLDEADHVLARLEASQRFAARVRRLQAAARQLRRSGILEELSRPGGDSSATALNRPYELLIARRGPEIHRAAIVFTGRERRFWLTINVLHQFLKRFDCHIIYLSDHSRGMFLNGLYSHGGSFEALLDVLRKYCVELGAERLHVMANSGGGFAGLKAALDLGAESFLGLAIQTDLSPGAPRRAGEPGYEIEACRNPRMLVNLRRQIEKTPSPPRIHLYCGELNPFDRAQAENVRGLPRVEINVLDGEATHDLVSCLLARGMFDGVLKRFFDSDGGSA